MGFVDDDQVEVPYAEAALAVAGLVDKSHHGGIGGNIDAPFGIFIGDQVHRRGIGKMCFENPHCLIYQRYSIRQEQNPLDPVAAHEEFTESNDNPGLAGPRGHDQQGFAFAVNFQRLADPADGSLLVVPFHNRAVDLSRCQGLTGCSPLDQKLQFRLLVESLHRARRVARIIPEPLLVAVGVKDHRPPAESGLQTVGIEFRLLLPHPGVSLGPLGLHQCQGDAVIPPEDVIDEPFPFGYAQGPLLVAERSRSPHAGYFIFPVPFLVQGPAGLLEEQIDEVIPGFGFGIVVTVRLG